MGAVLCVGLLSAAADGCSTTSMCCLYARPTDAFLRPVQCSSTAEATELSRHDEHVRRSSNVAASNGITNVTAGVATVVHATEDACDEPASNACQSYSHLASISVMLLLRKMCQISCCYYRSSVCLSVCHMYTVFQINAHLFHMTVVPINVDRFL